MGLRCAGGPCDKKKSRIEPVTKRIQKREVINGERKGVAMAVGSVLFLIIAGLAALCRQGTASTMACKRPCTWETDT